MQQGTDEWHEFRRLHIGASEAYTIWNENSKAWHDLWEEKLGLRVNDFDNSAMRHGRDTEPKARKWFSNYIGSVIWPDVKESNDLSFLSASLDGISLDGKILWEAKCPTSRRMLDSAMDGAILPAHRYQMQQQMYVYDADKVYYNIYYNDEDSHVFIYHRDDKWIGEYLIKAKRFWAFVESGDPPMLMNDTQEWRDAETWMLSLLKREKELKDQLKSIETEKASCLNTLKEISGDKPAAGRGVALSLCVRIGAVDYKKVDELKGVDLDRYRKNDITYWKATRVKNG